MKKRYRGISVQPILQKRRSRENLLQYRFFFILSLQLDNELPMSEMSKNREVTDFVFAIKRVKSYLNFEKSVLVTPHGLSGC